MRHENRNLDGQGSRRVDIYDLPATAPFMRFRDGALGDREYWPSVTDVPCPIAACEGFIRWAENGYTPGYRICDTCGRHFIAEGDAQSPCLIRVYDRSGGGLAQSIREGAKNLRKHLSTYGGRLLATDGRMTVEMIDPNDNSESRYQYRRGDTGLERRMLSHDEVEIDGWTTYTPSELAGLLAMRGNWHPILSPLGV
jgi:hypothetical protein